MQQRKVSPSESYQLYLPAEINEQHDSSASSFWISNEPLLLQLSSYIRELGNQVAARDRLAARIDKHQGAWDLISKNLFSKLECDEACAIFTDEDGLAWLHTYLVWPRLTIYATVSGPQAQVRDISKWPVQALASIELANYSAGAIP